jgi:hypothetical protein
MGGEYRTQTRFSRRFLGFSIPNIGVDEIQEKSMQIKRLIFTALIGAAATIALAGSASASPWSYHHPRRAEVNHRLGEQDHRINHDYRDGRISLHQARVLHREDRTMRHQERFDARFDGGHITRADQRALNRDENGVSRQIHRDAF